VHTAYDEDRDDYNNNNNPICKAPECQKTSVALVEHRPKRIVAILISVDSGSP